MSEFPSIPERRSEILQTDPKERERQQIHDAARSKTQRWVAAAMLMFSTEACAPFLSVVTGEGAKIETSELMGGFKMKPGERSSLGEQPPYVEAKIGVRPTKFEQLGAKAWWDKPEGVFHLAEWKLEKDTENLSEEKLRERNREEQNRRKLERRMEVPEEYPRISFEPEEQLPNHSIAVVHERVEDKTFDMVDRGVRMLGPALSETEGIKIEWKQLKTANGEKSVSARLSSLDAPDELKEDRSLSMEDAVLQDIIRNPEKIKSNIVYSPERAPRHAYAFIHVELPSLGYAENPTKDEIQKRSEAKQIAMKEAFALLKDYGKHECRIYVVQNSNDQDKITIVAIMDNPDRGSEKI
ncbi:MAG: hypothetical protein ABII13_03905 [Patescibacteria group bacterium]|nr:hypothetical protein [Patescibacteria group bacterium]MBU2509514.1 hypothetical protein [Patescibacteria group bacterium]